MIKQIAIFGASGRTGRILTGLLLEKGYRVNALVRNPLKFSIEHPNLFVIKGNVNQKEAIEQAIERSEVVVSVLGHVKGSQPLFQTKAVDNIIEVMKARNIKRFVVLTGSGVKMPEDKWSLANSMLTFIIKSIAPARFNDGVEQCKRILATDLDYTIVRAPLLTMQKPKGVYKTGYLKLGFFSHISRYDVAGFICNVIENQIFIKDVPQISY
ncbi:MAG TPA: NAD(P)H-binding protein [Bacteroidales bacterium]|nr:NAD(P)H-binding protein [Bacteroidales bacterium]